jgi:SNF2 family DNA or RNA helicase
MTLTPLKITNSSENIKGTGRYNKEEVFPCTELLMRKIKIKEEIIKQVLDKQSSIKHELKEETIKDLRPYQIDDVKFIAARKNCACFNEQRTGKTPTALRSLLERNINKFLIIAPASTIYTWANEVKRWNKQDCLVVDGAATRRKNIIESWKTGGLVISYECLREVTRYNEKKHEYTISGDLYYIKKHLTTIEACILDEAHRIKNHKSKQAQALFSLSGIPIKIALTGTPAPNKQYEIYSILHWLFPNIFSGYWRFIDYYFLQETRWNANGEYTEIAGFKKDKDIELQQFLNTISTRRLRKSIMEWLPDKERIDIKLECTKEQKEYMLEMRENFEINNADVTAVNVLDVLIKTRQLCLAPKVLELKGESPKINWIKQYIKDYPEEKILIFSNFTKWLKLLAKEIGCNNLIIGETTKAKREQLKNAFQNGTINILLLNIKAAKEGITLDTASTTIFTDKYPPVGDIQQAEDRFVATTKDKKDTGHTIISLIMKDTYEENIEKLLADNASDIDIINNYINYLKGYNHENM